MQTTQRQKSQREGSLGAYGLTRPAKTLLYPRAGVQDALAGRWTLVLLPSAKSGSAAAFSCGNLPDVAKALREHYPESPLILCGDNDQWAPINQGKAWAIRAARATGARLALPSFKDTTDRPTDFNDLYRLEGPERVKEQIDAAKSPRPVREVITVCAANVSIRPVEWAWEGRLVRGSVNILAGDPGGGKSLLTCELAAHLSRGTDWPDKAACPCGDIVIASAEDSTETTIVARLKAARADLKRVQVG